MNYTVYIIENPLRRLYIGLSEDPQKRLDDHNTGVSKWTKGKGPWRLVWTKECESLGEARKLENLLKRQKGGAGLYKITGLSSVSPGS
ncbi:MAG: GIY-YIG nuclease family protein [Kiritimatiellae bacterium]|jgi:putative endonuclease|nr:GIY-YIG nuclease family protein [Kiritimatiellia bacterium]